MPVAHAAHAHDDTPAGDRPGVLAPQESCEAPDVRAALRERPRVYPEATAERCTAALLLDVDPVGLVRNRKGPSGEGFVLEQYVSDRPYAASSFLSVAI